MSNEAGAIDPRIPVELHAAIEVAREEWQAMWPGMELDGTADVIVVALARRGFLRAGGGEEAGKADRRGR
jgi:hypothetical protein